MNNPSTAAFTIRRAVKGDAPQILRMIRELAEYENLTHEVVATEEGLDQTLFGPKSNAEVLLAEVAYEPVGFCLFFHNYSTFLGKPGVYIEDIFVRPDARGLGIGKALFAEVTRLGCERSCGRIEWSVLDWNRPAIEFYERMGAKHMKEWTIYRLTEEQFNYA
ncbi:MAG: GNAT family N-acetyltransferase [Pseudomonadota bacterium]|nr:GNAT family N-acetyltransferase [Pseudomonadota bacterium]